MTASTGDEPSQKERLDHRDLNTVLPQDPEFYRQALNYMPTPMLVVSGSGKLIYANHALVRLGGWDFENANLDFLSYVHPQDQDALAEAFVEIVGSPGARMLASRPWAEIYFRIVTAEGTTLPVEVVGSGALMDEAVGGIIYEVRPARTRNLLGRVLDGLSRGASMHHLLSLVGEMITSPPLDLEAVILQSTDGDGLMVASSTSSALSEAIRGGINDLAEAHLDREPARIDRSAMPTVMADRMQAAGFQDVWQVAVESPLTEDTLRIVAASPTHHVPANGPVNRLIRARELAAAVLLRTQADVLLEYAADHDPLTDLPNRAAFYQLAESLHPMTERAALHLDLDGLAHVNSELGQASGDAILQVVADRLRSLCSPDDIIARIGDDEFTIILTTSTDADSTTEAPGDRSVLLANAVLAAIQDTVVVGGRPRTMAASIGIAIAAPSVSTDHLLTWADAAMHDAKELGGNRVCRFGVSYG